MGDHAALLLRVGFSFSLVLGLMWLAARVLRSRTSGQPTDTVEVLARHQMGRGSAVHVLRIGDRALVLGVTERSITQLGDPITDLAALRHRAAEDTTGVVSLSGATKADNPSAFAADVIRSRATKADNPSEIADLLPAPRSHARRRTRSAPLTTAPSASQAMAGQGALAGSILSPATWRMGMDALRERTVRRG